MAGKLQMGVNWETRLCTVDGETGYFHIWEQYSSPSSTGVYSRLYGIVEFSDGIRRVDPTDIHFYDEEHSMLYGFNKHNEPGKLDDLEIIKERLMEAEQKEKDLCPTCKFDKGGSYSPMCTLCNDFDCYKKKGESDD